MGETDAALAAALREHMRLLDQYARRAGFEPGDYSNATARAEIALGEVGGSDRRVAARLRVIRMAAMRDVIVWMCSLVVIAAAGVTLVNGIAALFGAGAGR
ncbi:hypothetical protein [Microcystis phage Mwe-JY25]